MKTLIEKILNCSYEELDSYIKGTRELLEEKGWTAQEKELLKAFQYFLESGTRCKQHLSEFRSDLRAFIREVNKLKDMERDMGADFRIKKS